MPRGTRLAAVALFSAITSALWAQAPTQASAFAAEPATPSASAPTTAPVAPTSLAPTVEHASVGVKAPAPATDPLPLPKRADTSRNRALMIVGGAALIVGAVIHDSSPTGGALLMVGGAVAALFGLYQYLQ